MKVIIFYNDTGFPYSVLAAAVRSGKLPAHRLPERRELEQVLLSCGYGKGDASIYNLGYSKQGEKCLALWTNGNGDMVGQVVKSFLGLFHIQNYELIPLYCCRSLQLAIVTWLSCFPFLRGTGMSFIHRHVNTIYSEVIEAAKCSSNNILADKFLTNTSS